MQEDFTGGRQVLKDTASSGNTASRRTTPRGDRMHGRRGAQRRMTMGGKIDQMKGRIKEAVGVLTDDDRLKHEGKLDQVVGEVKKTAERVAEKVKETVAKAVEKVKDA
jgi:uncharacterized protein YjbJ (UPF0337 family)